MVAVDGFRLAVRREKLENMEGGAFSFVAPGSALSEVKGICADTEDLATVTLGRRHILFEVGDTELICRRLEGEFLDYKNAIPRKNLMEALRYAPADTVKIELNTGVSPAVIVPVEGEENFLYMVLPVRLKSAE